jgi:hypothetical protein
VELFVAVTEQYPRSLVALFLLGAWSFVYICLNIAIRLEEQSPVEGIIQLIRSAMILGAVFMLFGPLLIFRPVLKIIVKSRLGRAAVLACHHHLMRYMAFGLFAIVVSAQVVVVWALSLVLYRVFSLSIANTVGFSACYVLVSLFYLAAFYETMLRRPFAVKGKKPLKWMRYVCCGSAAFENTYLFTCVQEQDINHRNNMV